MYLPVRDASLFGANPKREMPPTPTFEVRGEWPLRDLPDQPEPWMVLGKVYVVVLRRRSGDTLPEAEVRDQGTDQVLALYTWLEARLLFGLRRH